MRPAALFVLFALLSACGISPVSPPPGGRQHWQERQRHLAGLDAWTMTGQVALSTADQGWQATLRWRQHTDDYDIRIIAPFGQGTVSLSGGRGGVTLRSTDDPRPVFAADAEALLYRRLGWHVPVEGLRYWVLGLPDPARRYTLSLDAEGRLARLRQAGWEVRFLRYRDVKGYQLPEKIFMNNDEVQVKLLIRHWRLEG